MHPRPFRKQTSPPLSTNIAFLRSKLSTMEPDLRLTVAHFIKKAEECLSDNVEQIPIWNDFLPLVVAMINTPTTSPEKLYEYRDQFEQFLDKHKIYNKRLHFLRDDPFIESAGWRNLVTLFCTLLIVLIPFARREYQLKKSEALLKEKAKEELNQYLEVLNPSSHSFLKNVLHQKIETPQGRRNDSAIDDLFDYLVVSPSAYKADTTLFDLQKTLYEELKKMLIKHPDTFASSMSFFRHPVGITTMRHIVSNHTQHESWPSEIRELLKMISRVAEAQTEASYSIARKPETQRFYGHCRQIEENLENPEKIKELIDQIKRLAPPAPPPLSHHS